MSNYAAKKESHHATDVSTSNLAVKKGFTDLKAEVDKVDINKPVNDPTGLNNLKTKVDHLDVGKLKTVSVDLKKLSDVVDDEVVKNTKFSSLKTKINNSENKIPHATTLIHINQYNTDKQNLEKKNWITTVLNTKISKVENKIRDTSGLVTTTILNTKISEVENKILDNSKYITTQ